MSADEPKPGVKSAYEAALEKLQRRGIEPPKPEAVTEEVRGKVAELRRTAEAKLAELEILHADRMRRMADPAEREQEEQGYLDERRRITERCEREIAQLRGT